VHGENVLNRR